MLEQVFERIAEAFNKGYGDVSYIDSLIMAATIIVIGILIILLTLLGYWIWQGITHIYYRISEKRNTKRSKK